MKTKTLILLTCLCGITSCSDDMITTPSDNKTDSHIVAASHISKTEAITIAQNILKCNSTTRTNNYNIDYILRDLSTRNGEIKNELGDTLVYIINFNNNGFAIIASDNRVNPLLAYSDTGSFDMRNDMIISNFIQLIEPYMDYYCNMPSTRSYPLDFKEKIPPVQVAPKLTTVLKQWAPYNKYVEERAPGYPAGCIPLATASIISHIKHTLVYDNRFYDFDAINNGIGGNHSLMSYAEATDKLARFICDIGIAMGVYFDDEKFTTWCSISAPLNLFSATNCNIKTTSSSGNPVMYDYDAKKISDFLLDSCLIYMTGCNADKTGYQDGHGWVVDGCAYYSNYDMFLQKEVRTCIYLHCDWGWDGSGNGYYTGDVFKIPGMINYHDFDYIAVK